MNATVEYGRITPSQFAKVMTLKMPHQVFFDIETGPKPKGELQKFFDPSKVKLPKNPGVFDPATVKYGNMKDPAKKQAKLEAKEGEHNLKVAQYNEECGAAHAEAFQEFCEKSTFHAELSHVVSIGYGYYDGDRLHIHLDYRHSEEDIVKSFWDTVRRIKNRGGDLYSFNGHSFDIPYMTRKAWIVGHKPDYLLTKYRKMEDFCHDALEHWRIGGIWKDSISLNHAARALGVAGKLEGMDGGMYWSTFRDNKERALDYLEHDVLALFSVCQRMGMLDVARQHVLEAKKKIKAAKG